MGDGRKPPTTDRAYFVLPRAARLTASGASLVDLELLFVYSC